MKLQGQSVQQRTLGSASIEAGGSSRRYKQNQMSGIFRKPRVGTVSGTREDSQKGPAEAMCRSLVTAK